MNNVLLKEATFCSQQNLKKPKWLNSSKILEGFLINSIKLQMQIISTNSKTESFHCSILFVLKVYRNMTIS